MTTKWAVTAASERVILDANRQGETTFTVTNPGPAAERAVFEVMPDEGADPAWFSVAEPRRLIRGGASVSYVVKVAVPADAPSGTYAVRPMVYSADGAPEESSVAGPRVSLEVAAADAVKPSRRWPWWWFVVAGLVVVVLAVVIALVATGGEESTSEGMPDVVGLSERGATRLLAQHGITVRTRYLHDPDQAGRVLRQSVPPGRTAGVAVVTLDVAVELSPPVITGPVGVVTGMTTDEYLELTWEPGELASSWNVILAYEYCSFEEVDDEEVLRCFLTDEYFFGELFDVELDPTENLDTPSYLLPLSFITSNGPYFFYTGWFRWQVEPLDADGNPGPASEPVFTRVGDIRLVQCGTGTCELVEPD